jgi:DNA polymerase III delta prime subunit
MTEQRPLTAAQRKRLEAFRDHTVHHPHLDEVDRRLMDVLNERGSLAHVIVFGPTGVGKSTVIRRMADRLNTVRRGEVTTSILKLVARPPDTGVYDHNDLYWHALMALGEPTMEVPLILEGDEPPKRGRAKAGGDQLRLRLGYEQNLQRRQVQAVIIDEAQYLLKGITEEALLNQLDWIKSLTDATGVLHILVGTYELVLLHNMSTQNSRRGYDVEFARYRYGNPDDEVAFLGAVRSILEHASVPVDLDAVLPHWPYFYERTIGCIGSFKAWLIHAVAALREKATSLTMDHLRRYAPTDAKVEQQIAEATDGERLASGNPQSQERIWRLLGMRESSPAPFPVMGTSKPPVQPAPKRRIGQRKPQRDPVGEAADPKQT